MRLLEWARRQEAQVVEEMRTNPRPPVSRRAVAVFLAGDVVLLAAHVLLAQHTDGLARFLPGGIAVVYQAVGVAWLTRWRKERP